MSALLCNHFFALKQMLQRLTKTNKVENGIFRINNNSHKKTEQKETRFATERTSMNAHKWCGGSGGGGMQHVQGHLL